MFARPRIVRRRPDAQTQSTTCYVIRSRLFKFCRYAITYPVESRIEISLQLDIVNIVEIADSAVSMYTRSFGRN